MNTNDDYNWDTYTKDSYLWEIDNMIHQGFSFKILKSTIVDGSLKFLDQLHENWKEIYYQINRLNPRSVFECGTGGGITSII